MQPRLAAAVTAATAVSLVAVAGFARSVLHHQRAPVRSPFALLEPSVAPARGSDVEVASWLSGTSVAAVGDGALVLDPDSGDLVRTDAAGEVTSRLAVAPGASQLVYDPGARRAFVSDRRGDRVVVVSVGDRLTVERSFDTRTEPYGVALTPDRKRLLVTHVADGVLVGYDAGSGDEAFAVPVGRDPRGVAVAPSGREALVSFVSTGAVARVELDASPTLRYVALDRAPSATPAFGGLISSQTRSGSGDRDGARFARSAFAITYLGDDLAVVAHQESTPVMATAGAENTGVYGGGGGFDRPVEHRLTFLALGDDRDRIARAEVSTHQPRAVAYDAERDLLYLAGYGSDDVMALADASKPSVHRVWQQRVAGASACGPTGLDVAEDGSVVVFCSLSREVARLRTSGDAPVAVEVTRSGPVATTRLSVAAARGRALFRLGNDSRMSSAGAMACESCHPEGRTDGLSWRIGGTALQTPLLAGRTLGAHPFKWDGGDETLQVSLRSTVTRLGGTGIDEAQAADIAAYLASLPPPRTPTVADDGAVARGHRLFDSDALGCAGCHAGKLLTNRQSYDLATDLERVDTPSLIGLAASAPYYHDGSATTLRSLLLDNADVHGMAKLSALAAADVDDLVAYLKTL